MRNAGLDLNRFKLQLDKTAYVNNDDVPRDHVVGQDPLPLADAGGGRVAAHGAGQRPG